MIKIKNFGEVISNLDFDYNFSTFSKFYTWMKLHPEMNLDQKKSIHVDGVAYDSPLDVLQKNPDKLRGIFKK